MLSSSFINNVSTKAFEKTIVDIFRDICLSVWAGVHSLECVSGIGVVSQPFCVDQLNPAEFN